MLLDRECSTPRYTLTWSSLRYRPLFEKVTLEFPAAKKPLVITAKDSASKQYIKSYSVDGKGGGGVTISYAEVSEGGEIIFEMTDNASEAFASSYSSSRGNLTLVSHF